jgi:predicted acyltransferase
MSVLAQPAPSQASRPAADAPPPPTTAPASQRRLQSLDAYRGLIMLTLLCGGIFHSLKDVPGWQWLATQNEHVEWEGCVYWDLIQPSFMFMVGVAMPFAFARRSALGDSWAKQFRHTLVRAFNLAAIGIILDHVGSNEIQIGFIRVLQQIAFGYVVAFFVVGRSFRTQALAAAAILVGYNLLWMFNPWNGPGGPWAQGNQNIGSAFDMWLLGRHYSGYYVGMNAIPSTATIIFGVMAGQLILQTTDLKRTCRTLLIAGLAGIGLGLAVSPWLPLIKRIWTPSFAVYSAGWTTLILLAFYWIIEVMGIRRWAFPLVVVGMNSIAAYVIGSAFRPWFRGATRPWVAWLEQPLGPAWFPVFQSALFAAAAWCVLYWLYRRKVFFKC